MRVASVSTPVSWVLALAFLGLAIPGIWERFDSASYNREVFPEYPTEPLGGDRYLDYEFTARYDHVASLWIFVDAGTTTWPRVRLKLSIRELDQTQPFWSQDFDVPRPESGTGDRFCAVENLTLHRDGRYIMRFEMPDIEPGKAWRIRVNYWDGSDGVVRWEGHEVRGVEPVMVWLGSRPQFPGWQLWSGAVLVAAWSLIARERTRFAAPAWIVMAAGCALLAAYGWQYRLWQR